MTLARILQSQKTERRRDEEEEEEGVGETPDIPLVRDPLHAHARRTRAVRELGPSVLMLRVG